MSQPVWITPAGSLGTIPEGVFFQLPLLAEDPGGSVTGNITSGSAVITNVIGIANLSVGKILSGTGIPTGSLIIAINTTAKTVTINNTATSTTATTTITYNGSTVYYEVIAGQLPAGIQCEENGLIVGIPKAVVSVQGVPEPVSRDITSKFAARVYTKKTVNGVEIIDRLADRTFTITVTGQDAPEWVTAPGQIGQFYDGSLVDGIQLEYSDSDPDDIVTVSLVSGSLPTGTTLSNTGLISGFIDALPPTETKHTYNFIAAVSDGKNSNLRAFNILVWNRQKLTADNTVITADNTFITADASPYRPPILITPQGSIGTVRNDNFFAFQFIGKDLDGDPIQYELGYDPGDSTLLPGLTLDPNTGWLFGYIPNLGLTENTYNFYVQVRKAEYPTIISDPYYYSLSITGPVDSEVTWLVPSDLGTINNGSVSEFYVAATTPASAALQYELLSGSNSNLPQGLSLLPTGDISGRVSFNTFALDLGTTTFDVTLNDLSTGSDRSTETTFDMKHSFVVRVFNSTGLIDISKTFSITVRRTYNEPYENLYIMAMPPQNDRDFIASLLQNADIFQPNLLYRPTDPNFGKAKSVTYYHAFGLRSSTIAEYVASLDLNHYWKNLVLGSIKVAQARNSADEIIYEVVYSQVVDNLVNNQGESVGKEVTLPYAVEMDDSSQVTTVYPNSLVNMRDQVIDQVGQVSTVLPTWMTSKQANGKILGFTPAWVLAYVLPGHGNQVAYYIKEQFGEPLNLIDFKVDRYELDRLLSIHWDPVADSAQGAWFPTPAATTFDVSTEIVAWQNNSGTIVDWENNLEVEIRWANGSLAPLGTIFDGNSLQFIAPVDMYTNTTAYDKYLVFPKRNILE
jgi:hypothetical protein